MRTGADFVAAKTLAKDWVSTQPTYLGMTCCARGRRLLRHHGATAEYLFTNEFYLSGDLDPKVVTPPTSSRA